MTNKRLHLLVGHNGDQTLTEDSSMHTHAVAAGVTTLLRGGEYFPWETAGKDEPTVVVNGVLLLIDFSSLTAHPVAPSPPQKKDHLFCGGDSLILLDP